MILHKKTLLLLIIFELLVFVHLWLTGSTLHKMNSWVCTIYVIQGSLQINEREFLEFQIHGLIFLDRHHSV